MENNNYFQSAPPPPGPQWQQPWGNMQVPLPNSTGVLVLGICSLVGCIFYGIPGLILSIIALAVSVKPKKMYESNPQQYTVASYNNLKAGRVCAIVGLALSICFIIFLVVVLITAINHPYRVFGWH